MKKSLLFTIKLLPIAIIGGISVGFYSFESYSLSLQNQIIEQLGSLSMFILVSTIQSLIYTIFCGGIGYYLSHQIGLWKEATWETQYIKKSLLLGSLCGVVYLFIDTAIFAKLIPSVAKTYQYKPSFYNWMASLFYGGVIEEVMLRLFFMSLIVFMIWKIFFRHYTKDKIPYSIFIIANVISALIFAAGHIPATITTLGISPIILMRCFLLNGGFGFIFGWLYQHYGIEYAMIGHISFHIISKFLWLLFL